MEPVVDGIAGKAVIKFTEEKLHMNDAISFDVQVDIKLVILIAIV